MGSRRHAASDEAQTIESSATASRIARRRSAAGRMGIACLAIWMSMSACHKWVPVESPGAGPERAIATDQVRAHMNDGSVITLHGRSFEPIHVEGDQLIGYRTAEASSQAAEPGRMSLPLSNVREIERRTGDGLATAGAVAGGLLGGLLVIGLVACAASDDPFGC